MRSHAEGGARWVQMRDAGGEPLSSDGSARTARAGTAAIECAVRALEAGAVLVHPTSTVYGLGGRPGPRVDAEVARLKGREGIPLIHLGADVEEIRHALPHLAWTESARRLAERFWPGPLTLVLDDGTPTGLAVRVDGHPVLRKLLARAGGLMTSSSLNLTGEPPALKRDDARRAIERLAPGGLSIGWLDAGDLAPSAPSTLISLRAGRVDLVREGAVPASDIAAALDRPVGPVGDA